MLTNNFIPYLYGCSKYNDSRAYRTYPVKDLTGTEYDSPKDNEDNPWIRKFSAGSSTEYGAFWLVLGADDTPVTKDDYKLGNEVTGLTAGVGDYIVNDNKIRIYRTYANNTDSDIEVSEVGLVVKSNTHSGQKNILIAREVLEQAITIKPGGTQVFGIDIG